MSNGRGTLASATGRPTGRAGARTATYIMCCAAWDFVETNRGGRPRLCMMTGLK